MFPSTDSQEDDLTLFQKTKADSETAFKTLFLRYYNKLCLFVEILYHDPTLAEEAVQEVFVKIWEKRHEIEIRASVKYYLYGACRHQAHNLVAKKANQHIALSEALENIMTEALNPEQVFSYNSLYHDFQEAVDALPPKAKEVFLLKYYKKARHKEIAQRMNISESMVEKHASNALRHLRKNLASHAISLSFALFLLIF